LQQTVISAIVAFISIGKKYI